MNQSFNKNQVLKYCKQAEILHHRLSLNELSNQLDLIFEDINNNQFEFKLSKVNEYYLTKELSNKLILRKLNDNLKRLYKDEQANRRIIISQVKTLLEETCPFWIVKSDIKSFYESIKRDRVIAKFQDDAMLSYQSIYLLKKIFENPTLESISGVPRGMNISSTISEIYMRRFDRWIRRFNGVYYYARFVDDIIIFTNSLQSATNLISILNTKLDELAEGLVVNENKTELFEGNHLKSLNKTTGKQLKVPNPLEYLGYSFKKKHLDKNNSTLHITIADKKIRKIKTRIILSFVDFLKNKDFKLLENRIKFLTGNYSIKKGSDGNDLKAGVYFNYLQVSDLSIFEELNSFYRKVLFSKKQSFGSKLNISLSQIQKNKLNKYCFKTGFKLKVYTPFTFDEVSSIINCW